MPRLDLAVALGVGVGGALVDVSSYARLTDGLTRRWGRDDAFYGVDPGTFSFVLDNSDGRFTPDNPLSPLDTTLTEGMAACISVGGRLTGGTVRTVEPEFPGGVAAWASVRVTCDDALGELSRRRLSLLADDLVEAAGTFGLWKFADPVTSSVAVDSGPYALPAFQGSSANVTLPAFGASPLSWVGDTQGQLIGPATAGTTFLAQFDNSDFGYPTGSAGAYGFWLTPNAFPTGAGGTMYFRFSVIRNNGANLSITLQNDPGDLQFLSVSNGSGFGATLFGPTLTIGAPVYVAIDCYVDGAQVRQDIYIDGVLADSVTSNHGGATSSADLSPASLTILVGSSVVTSDLSLSRVVHSLSLPREELFRDAVSTAGGLSALDASVSGVTFATLPTNLAEAEIVLPAVDGSSALDLLNDLLVTEQGDVYTTTTGTLTAPTSQVAVRERARPETVSYTFDVENELSGAPDFIRDLTNLVSRVTVSSDAGSTIVADSTLTGRAGQASATETVLLASEIDRRAWGQDRLIRGANTRLRIASVVVDAMTTPTDRSADLLALVPGDRVQFTGLPETVLGFDTWDGWFLGASERHDIESHTFQLHFTPTLPNTAKYDTATYMASGELALNGAINSSATSISVESTGALLSTTAVPYVMQIDDEQMTVTAVSGASSPQTVTVTRAANGTTAASHSDAALLVGPVPESIYAF